MNTIYHWLHTYITEDVAVGFSIFCLFLSAAAVAWSVLNLGKKTNRTLARPPSAMCTPCVHIGPICTNKAI